ncbi:MAG TPA: TetR/AcrR family transcriptional regulator [Thermoanaerobaculia bacterium]|nr:TetR/AcrR family transcriptional regulator [Thermoanaerobaculia bacterium]
MGKGAETKERILEQAVGLASRDGLDGLSIGGLATELGLSKSGLFAHFGSKEELQLQVLQAAVERFREVVVRPGLAAPRGEPRIRVFFERWLDWDAGRSLPGGCILIAAATELDDRPGPQRELLVRAQRDWFDALAKAARIAVEEGHFRADLDAEQFAFQLYGIVLGYHHSKRLLRDPRAPEHARGAYQRLIDSVRP